MKMIGLLAVIALCLCCQVVESKAERINYSYKHCMKSLDGPGAGQKNCADVQGWFEVDWQKKRLRLQASDWIAFGKETALGSQNYGQTTATSRAMAEETENSLVLKYYTTYVYNGVFEGSPIRSIDKNEQAWTMRFDKSNQCVEFSYSGKYSRTWSRDMNDFSQGVLWGEQPKCRGTRNGSSMRTNDAEAANKDEGHLDNADVCLLIERMKVGSACETGGKRWHWQLIKSNKKTGCPRSLEFSYVDTDGKRYTASTPFNLQTCGGPARDIRTVR